jgi:hypothetical protein
MIIYKPVSDKDVLRQHFQNFDFNQEIYGGYIGVDEDGNNVGECLFSIDGFKCHIHIIDCDLSDKLLVEGFLRASLNYCANRNAYMAYCSITDISDVLAYLGFESINGIFSGDIPTLLKGSCCK